MVYASHFLWFCIAFFFPRHTSSSEASDPLEVGSACFPRPVGVPLPPGWLDVYLKLSLNAAFPAYCCHYCMIAFVVHLPVMLGPCFCYRATLLVVTPLPRPLFFLFAVLQESTIESWAWTSGSAVSEVGRRGSCKAVRGLPWVFPPSPLSQRVDG
jgi:hypothetical protein